MNSQALGRLRFGEVFESGLRFLRQPSIEQHAYVAAVCWLAIIGAMLRVCSFQQILTFVSRRRVRRPTRRRLPLLRLQAIIQKAGARVPSTCLSRSLAGAAILARFGYASDVLVGVSSASEFRAHAWIECEGVLIGEASVEHWTELTRLSVGF